MPGQLLLPRGPASIRQARPATSPPGGGPYIVSTYASWMSDGFGNGFAFTTDTDVAAGDWAICCVTDSQAATPPVTPTGVDRWQLLHTNNSSTSFEASWYALYNPRPVTTYTWSITGGRRSIVAAVIRGADPQQLLDGTPNSLATAAATIHASNTVTTTGPWRLLLAFPVLRAFPTARWSPHSSWRMWTEAFGADASTNMDVALLARAAQTAGPYSDAFTLAGTEPAIVGLLAVRPAGATDPPVGKNQIPIHPGRGPRMSMTWRTTGSTDLPTAGGAGVTLAGVAPAAADLDGTVSVARAAAGKATAAADLDGSLSVARPLTAKSIAAAALTGAARVARAVAGRTPAATHAAGALRAARPIAGKATAASSAAGSLTVTGPSVVALAGAIAAASHAAGAAATSRRLTGRASAAAAFTGALTVGVPFTPALVAVDSSATATTTDGRAAAVGNAGGGTGTTGQDGTLTAAQGLSGGTTATGYL